MTTPEGYCSKCHEDWMNCRCPEFHPNRLHIDEIIVDKPFTISKDEVLALYDYFLNRAGFISYEFDEKVHKIIKRMEHYIG